jgi:hypothetical protein
MGEYFCDMVMILLKYSTTNMAPKIFYHKHGKYRIILTPPLKLEMMKST